MKKLSLLLMAVAFLCPKVANAQDGKGSINLVPYVGVNYSDFSGDASLYFGKTSGKVNFMVGARLEFQIADKSAFITDVNYRRLGVTTDAYTQWFTLDPIGNGWIVGDYDKDELIRELKERRGVLSENKTVTLDYITLALQFKQNIIGGLSARAGLEASGCLAKKWNYHYSNYYYYKDTGECIEGDESSDADDVFTDNDYFSAAVPLGLTYDYKNFSVNATYHLPLTKCAENKGCYFRNQAFDFTIGYRLPLRKK